MNLDLRRLIPRTDIRYSFDIIRGERLAWSQETVNALSLNPPGQPGGQPIISPPYLYRPYTGNSGIVRLRYFW